MKQTLALLIFSGLLEIAVAYWLWKFRRLLSVALFVILLCSSLYLLFVSAFRLWVLALVLISIYQLFVLFRMAFGRINTEHLKNVSRHSTLRLWLLQLLIVGIGSMLTYVSWLSHNGWLVLSLAEFMVVSGLLLSTLRHKSVTKRIKTATVLIDKDAPTLTVAIPARNETDDLNECLSSILACDYPKLEILVLDDQSTTRRTPEIIRSFAHDGVEFIAGKSFDDNWLAKNWAYQQLLDAANGELILFCGADTRFEPESLKFLVSSLLSRNKNILAVLPKNSFPGKLMLRLLQPLRYAWEISLPRRGLNRPPVLSTCWLAKRRFLIDNGGFKAVSRQVVVESYFARQALKDDGYSFFQYEGVASVKRPYDQLETAVRLRYPQLHLQPELVGSLVLIEFLIVGSLPLLVYSIIANSLALVFSLATVLLLCVTFGQVSFITYRRNYMGGYLSWPLACLADIYLMNLSMCRYEFGTVLWKGRSVAPPVIRARFN